MKFLLVVSFALLQQCWAQYGGNQAANPYGATANEYAPPAPKTGYGDETAAEAAGAGFEEPTTTKNPFPHDDCYINDDGFLCCNKELEKLMSDTYQSLAQSRGGNWKKCNRDQVTLAVQRAAEPHFNHKFEVVTGAGDYASKNNFDGNLICKIKREKSIILAYGTPTFA